ncbi:hypothetical protein [Desulfobacter curvatus]|uniref:hypothetical protein n=1 Tax=Desulfobacter curvatus TaxID=2290 RepID=UPI00036C21DF|nr:hypothetical protein [Desulfobacter curvatus]
MSWIPKVLIAVAASNTFGAINFFLKTNGIVLDYYRIFKIIILIVAYRIAILAYRPQFLAAAISYIFLILGIISAIWAIYTGIQVGANTTLILGIIWVFGFTIAIYWFYKHQNEFKNIAQKDADLGR